MIYEDLKSFLKYDEKENDKVYMPNEIFNDFWHISGSSSEVPFGFSFYYLIMYLYRTTKYGSENYTVQDLKEILGYARNNQTMNNLIKRDGVLSRMGYIEQTTNTPISWSFDSENQVPVFTYYDDFINEHDEEEMRYFREHMNLFMCRKNKVIKVPLKGLYRTRESCKNGVFDGTFFNVQNTTQIPMEVFLWCMSEKDLGVEAFWTYSYIKYKNDCYNDVWNVPRHTMERDLRIGPMKLNRILTNLEKFDMIYNDHKPFIIGLPRGMKMKACSFKALDYNGFHKNDKEIKKRDIVDYKEWCEEKGFVCSHNKDSESYKEFVSEFENYLYKYERSSGM